MWSAQIRSFNALCIDANTVMLVLLEIVACCSTNEMAQAFRTKIESVRLQVTARNPEFSSACS